MLTVRLMRPPFLSVLPARGVSAMTRPLAYRTEGPRRTRPVVQRDRAIIVFAFASPIPTSFGTLQTATEAGVGSGLLGGLATGESRMT